MRRFMFRFFILVSVCILGIATGGYLALIKGVPDIEEIKDYQPPEGTKVYADDDTLIGEFKMEKGIYVPLEKIPEHLIKAVIAVEDSRFWFHRGVDYVAILRALFKDIRARRIKEGGSTITQQLAKVIFLSPERTIIRKLKEAILAFRLEKNLSKEEILELYLNRIYFGHGAYGVEMAARRYFGKSVSDLNLAEAALLSGLIKAPARYSPYNNLDRAKKRQLIVLRRMREENYISRKQMEEAYKQPLYLASLRRQQEKPNYFLEYIRKYLEDKYGFEMVYKEGLKVYTTLNKKMQIAAVRSLQEGLRKLDKRQGFRGVLGHKDINVEKELNKKIPFKKVIMRPGDISTATVLSVEPSKAIVKTRGILGILPLSEVLWVRKIIDSKGNVIKKLRAFKLKNILRPGDIITVRLKGFNGERPVFKLEQEPLVQGAIVAIEPSTGYIRALVGGYDFSKSEFNRAIYAKRQAGSAFKPIIYAAAMDNGFTPASIIIDEPVNYPGETFGDWQPTNYDEEFHGPTRLREALAYSRNIVTIKLLERLGVEKVINFAKALGIKGPFPYNLTLALGSLSVTPLEITSAFCVFANEGVKMEPIAVKYIIDSNGNILENNEPRGRKVISPQTAFLITSMLEDVVKYGTGWRARALKRPVAGKTGTTNDYRDAWFVGYTPELAAGVWVGFDDHRQLGEKETGSKAAAPIWVSFMKEALAIISPFGKDGKGVAKPFPIPEGIIAAVIDPLTGLLATDESEKMIEYFKEGTAPVEYSTELERNLVKRQKEILKELSMEMKNQDSNNLR
jgi:penicillin-binding protein 1A